jgi:hypothetical protein
MFEDILIDKLKQDQFVKRPVSALITIDKSCFTDSFDFDALKSGLDMIFTCWYEEGTLTSRPNIKVYTDAHGLVRIDFMFD